MALTTCRWDYCRVTIAREYGERCPDHRDMKWWEEFSEHVEHLCWEEEEIPLDEFEDVIDIIHDCRQSGGPREAAIQIESQHGIDPSVFGERFK